MPTNVGVNIQLYTIRARKTTFLEKLANVSIYLYIYIYVCGNNKYGKILQLLPWAVAYKMEVFFFYEITIIMISAQVYHRNRYFDIVFRTEMLMGS